MNVYTDPKLLDVVGALDTLPALPLNDGQRTEQQVATGTDPRTLVPTYGNRSISGSIADTPASRNHDGNDEPSKRISDARSKRKPPLSSGDNENTESGWRASNSRPLDPQALMPICK